MYICVLILWMCPRIFDDQNISITMPCANAQLVVSWPLRTMSLVTDDVFHISFAIGHEKNSSYYLQINNITYVYIYIYTVYITCLPITHIHITCIQKLHINILHACKYYIYTQITYTQYICLYIYIHTHVYIYIYTYMYINHVLQVGLN